MQVIKVPVKEAQRVKKHIIDNDLFEKNHRLGKENEFLYFPVKESEKLLKMFPQVEISNFKLTKVKRKVNPKESITKYLTDEEKKKLKTAFDLVGDIAILEIHETLAKKEEIIAKYILKSNKSIKTIVKKSGIHHGTFRTQDVVHVAGEKKTEATYIENSTKFLVDVSTVYFSPRLATERKRIYNDIKEGEEVLTMFSGAGPYPCVLAKNSKAKYVTGVEINPAGYFYSQKNLRLNKLSNVFFINGDVREVIPNITKSIIGLKCSIQDKAVTTILKEKPKLIELWTENKNFSGDENLGFKKLKETINRIKSENIHVVIHQPIKEGDKLIDMSNAGISNPIFKKMTELAKEFGVDLIIHLNNINGKVPLKKIIYNVKTFNRFYSQIYFKNTNKGVCSTKEDILEVIEKSGLKKICIDTCHYLHQYSNSELIEIIQEIQSKVSTYFHLSDYKDEFFFGIIDQTARINIQNILPFVNKGIVNVVSKDHDNPADMINSWNYINKFSKKYDRVIMPLPKTADEFLSEALVLLKDGGVINFYDFLHVDNFDQAVKKIKRACKEKGKSCEMLNIVRCGQHAPKIFRICVDAKITDNK